MPVMDITVGGKSYASRTRFRVMYSGVPLHDDPSYPTATILPAPLPCPGSPTNSRV